MTSSAMPMARKAVLRIGLVLRPGGRAGLAAGRLPRGVARGLRLLVRGGGEDQDLLEPREIDRGLRRHLLVDAEIPPGDLRHGGDGDALREAAADAARDEQIAHLDLVGALHVLHLARVLALVAAA